MRHIITALMTFICLHATAGNRTFEKLAEVNKCWLEQKDVNVTSLPVYTIQSEKEWIRTHLAQVEKTLRGRDMSHLTPSQQQKRIASLDHLNRYWHEGNFPINDQYAYRTPIFIDQHDNFCAVGYLIKTSGNEAVSRMIAAKTNLAYVRQMNYKEVYAWAGEYGFTEDELAWIQPSYPPVRHSAPVGGGTDGEIKEMFADNVNGKLYVGGKFEKIDNGTITANNIAYVTETGGNYTWHNMGSGVNGIVNAITPFNNKIFVAGNFTNAGSLVVDNVAYWDGSNWHSAGCLSGTVNDLIVYENELYAAGQFDVCGNLMDVNFAKWNGTMWLPYSGLIGRINTMEVMNNELLLGGNFTFGISIKNVAKWDKINGFQPFANTLENEVNDFEKFNDTMYVVCSRTSATDSSLINKLNGSNWEPAAPYLMSFYPVQPNVSFKTLCTEVDTLMLGGEFFLSPMVGHFAQNCYTLFGQSGAPNWFNVDSAINKMVVFNNQLIAGGKFQYSAFGFGWGATKLNNITRKAYNVPTNIKTPESNAASLVVYPNPVTGDNHILIRNDFNADKIVVTDMSGRVVISFDIKDKESTLQLPQLPAGSYMLEASNGNGIKTAQKLLVQ